MYIFAKFAKIDSKAFGGRTELLLCLVTYEQKLLKGNNSTCSLTDFFLPNDQLHITGQSGQLRDEILHF